MLRRLDATPVRFARRALQPRPFMQRSVPSDPMRRKWLAIGLAASFGTFPCAVPVHQALGADLTTSGSSSSVPPPPSDSATYAGDSNAAKARALVNAAINITDSNRAVNMLWQATDLDPTLEEAYVYLALYYNSRSQFDRVVQVYQKLVKYRPKETSAWMNIGEAYLSYTPPRFDEALPYFRKAFELDPTSSFAALRLGEIYAQQNNRDEAFRYLRMARGDRAKNPEIAEQADRLMRQMGS
jgi:tetratricopeptide (TPR) repeat protein